MTANSDVASNLGVRGPKLHAIYTVLNEADLFAASLASIYDFVQGITVITQYDRDWMGKPVRPDDLVHRILDRTLDPSNKINLIVAAETNEARARNRAMDFAHPCPLSRRVRTQHLTDGPIPAPDYFWIVDADEIYDSALLPNLLTYVETHQKPYYRVAAKRYFKTWDYVIDGHEWFTVFVRSDRRLGDRRNPYPYLVERLLGRIRLTTNLPNRLKGSHDVPPDIGLFHHGSYVGPRERIAAKIAGFSHSDQIDPDWLHSVWDQWGPSVRNFHPVHPAGFPGARRIPISDLPREIRDWRWPPGYLIDSTTDPLEAGNARTF